MLEETNIVTEDADNNLSNNMGIQEDSVIQDNEIEQSIEEITENDSTSDNNRYELRAKIREKLNELQDERRSKSDSVIHTKKRIIPERVCYQPRRNVKPREQYRKEQVEGSSSIQKNIGTQCFQRKGRG